MNSSQRRKCYRDCVSRGDLKNACKLIWRQYFVTEKTVLLPFWAESLPDEKLAIIANPDNYDSKADAIFIQCTNELQKILDDRIDKKLGIVT